ncbi:replication protein C [Pandoraea communis]|uniref:Replication protein C n=1 Tax=Pandoraea communis TaxID=2508297 RepID=A0A5E4YQF5_9BURK|nr:replication protein C, IncQ-type [Pandoraea communis]VVE50578.1 replication protein C [Pandoraea communis]
MSKHAPTYAKLAHAIVHVPGLFRSLAPGERRATKLDVSHQLGEVSVRCLGFEPLDAVDLRVLQGVVSIVTSELASVRPLLRDGRTHKASLMLAGTQMTERVLGARFNLAALARSSGFDQGGSAYQKIRASLQRLSNVTVVLKRENQQGSCRLVGSYVLDQHTGELVMSLSPLLSAAVLARRGYLRINMSEVHLLKKEVALLLHNRLHWINQGTARHVTLDTLIWYAYPDAQTGTTLRKRRKAVRDSLGELRRIGWFVTETSTGKFCISRPLRSVADRPQTASVSTSNW